MIGKFRRPESPEQPSRPPGSTSSRERATSRRELPHADLWPSTPDSAPPRRDAQMPGLSSGRPRAPTVLYVSLARKITRDRPGDLKVLRDLQIRHLTQRGQTKNMLEELLQTSPWRKGDLANHRPDGFGGKQGRTNPSHSHLVASQPVHDPVNESICLTHSHLARHVLTSALPLWPGGTGTRRGV